MLSRGARFAAGLRGDSSRASRDTDREAKGPLDRGSLGVGRGTETETMDGVESGAVALGTHRIDHASRLERPVGRDDDEYTDRLVAVRRRDLRR